MSKYTTIKVTKKTLRKLHEIVGELTKQRGERVSLEDAILKLLETRNEFLSQKKTYLSSSSEDREAMIQLLNQTFEGAGPEDFIEYDYEDISKGD